MGTVRRPARAAVIIGVLFGSLTLLATPSRASHTVDVTACGAIVPKHTTGIVQNDLDCSGQLLVGLLRGATLDVNGHVVSGEISPALAKATVVGPGALMGRITAGPDVKRLRVRDLDIIADEWGIFSDSGTVQVQDVTITGATFRAITAERVELEHVDVSNNPVDAFAVFAARIRGSDVTANANGAPGCTSCTAIYAYTGAKLVGLSASNNTGFGAFGITLLQLEDSTVTDNNGAGVGIDVAAGGNLVVVNTTCGLSGSSEPPYSPGYWGVCTND